MKITIQGISEIEILELIGNDEMPQVGDKFMLLSDLEAINTTPRGRSFNQDQIFHFLIVSVGSISINLLSSYLYDKLKTFKGNIKMKINDRNVEIEEYKIKRQLERSLSDTEITEETIIDYEEKKDLENE